MLQDLRFALRSIVKTPVFTAVVVLTLTVGIGGATAIGSVAKAMLFKPLPFPDADRLVIVGRGPGAINANVNMATFFLLRDRFSACEHIGARTGRPGVNLASAGHAEYVSNALVTAGYFEALGVMPLYGRPFQLKDEQVGGPRIVIVEYSLAVRSFGSARDAIGKPLTLGRETYEVVGVLSEHSSAVLRIDVWRPLVARGGAQSGLNQTVICKLRADVTPQAAAAQLRSLQPEYAALHADPSMKELASQQLDLAELGEFQTRNYRDLVLLLAAAVGIVLLIACANSAWLFSARAVDRRSEAAVRAALGAGRWRIVRQMLSESVLLTLIGGVLGIVLATWALPPLLSLPQGQGWDAEMDIVVFGGAALLSVFAGALCGLVPALRHARLDPIEALQSGSRRVSTSRDAAAMRRVMVFGEVMLCVVLLVASGLFVRSLARLQAVDVGFHAPNVLTAQTSMDDARYRSSQWVNVTYDRVLARLSAAAGVESAAVVTNIPVDRGLNLPIRPPVPIEGLPVASVDWRYVTEDYFRALRIPVRQGRTFSASDHASAPAVAIVNEAFVKRYIPDGKPLGHLVELNAVAGVSDARHIVGVVGNTAQQGLRTNPPPTIYVPARQVPDRLLTQVHQYFPVSWVVRYRSTSAGLTDALSAAIRAEDPHLPLSRVRTMEEVVDAALGQTQMQAVLLTVFGGVSVLMAITALAGSILYAVMRRKRDIGVRLALGASTSVMLRSIVAENLVLVAGGVVAGLGAAMMLGGLLRPFLFGITATDSVTYVTAAVLLFCIALATSVISALPVLRIHPADTLRAE
jgi:putative ABC transport system permease protein